MDHGCSDVVLVVMGAVNTQNIRFCDCLKKKLYVKHDGIWASQLYLGRHAGTQGRNLNRSRCGLST